MTLEWTKEIPNWESEYLNMEDVGGVIANQGELCMMIVQKRKEVEEAREELKKTGYYDNWTPEMKERIIDR